ncbi:MAG: hypothetical protein IJB11_03995, partial [Oscillospiraceae bacterium]|nr:hypothetical protein [Oscillospiraceae bacterium]
MTKRICSVLLVCALALTCIAGLSFQTEAATGTYAPYANINYNYSSTVTCGTIRYISQVSSDSYFYSSYWPSSTFGYYTGPSVECGTASISMSLSYIGINKTPDDILSANNGATVFGTGWGGSTYKSYSASALATATDNYINGAGKYSPPVIHIPGYSSAGHYVVVIGRSGTTYQILDPWQRAVTSMTVSGASATYSKYGYTTYDTIDQIHQWYNSSATIDSTTTTDYTSSLEFLPSHCKVKCNISMTVNTLPCSIGSNGSTSIETYAIGDIYTTTGIYKNTFGNYWYQVISKSGKVGYMYGDNADLVEVLDSDITLTGASYPNGHVVGSGFNLSGTVSASYNQLTNVTLKVHSGFGTSGAQVVGYSDATTGKSYPLAYSNIDAYTKFGTLTTGNYTYAIYASYQNYYTTGATTLGSSTGTVVLADEYFVVIPSAANQSSCSHSYTTTEIPGESCFAPGTQIKACSKCGLISESATSGSHSYGSWVTTPATCTASGSRTRTCTLCGDIQTEAIAATGHSYTSKTTSGTCTTPGTTVYTCTGCGDSYTETTATAGHSYDEGKVITPATCGTTGVMRYTCTVCGHSYDKSIYAGEHTYDNGVVVTPAGCNSTGVMRYTCTTCGHSYQKSIYATGHTYTTRVVAPTCTKTGYTVYTCTGCGSTYNADSVPATGHTYGTGVVTPPTCTTGGKTTFTCMDCGSSYTDQITNSLGHNYKSVVTQPTCSSQGYTTYTCTVCGHSYTGNTVPATAHTYSSKVTAPTCTAMGYTTYSCINCGYSYTGNNVSATGHSYQKSIYATGHTYTTRVVAPTCTKTGYTVYTCTGCGS